MIFHQVQQHLLYQQYITCSQQTPSVSSQPSFNAFPTETEQNLHNRYQGKQKLNKLLRLDVRTIAAPPPLYGPHKDSTRLQS